MNWIGIELGTTRNELNWIGIDIFRQWIELNWVDILGSELNWIGDSTFHRPKKSFDFFYFIYCVFANGRHSLEASRGQPFSPSQLMVLFFNKISFQILLLTHKVPQLAS